MKTNPANNGSDEAESRGEAARQKLIRAAIDLFGCRGFDGATTRALADAAGVNLQAIPYYFGGKQGLYIAAAEHIAATIAGRMHVAREEALTRLPAGGGKDFALSRNEARRLLTEILQAMARMFVSQESAAWARFLIREQMEPTEAFSRVYDGVMKPLLDTIRGLVGRLLEEDPTCEHVRLRTMSLIGGVMVFRVARAAVMAQLEWTSFDDREIELVQELARELAGSLGPPGAAT